MIKKSMKEVAFLIAYIEGKAPRRYETHSTACKKLARLFPQLPAEVVYEIAGEHDLKTREGQQAANLALMDAHSKKGEVIEMNVNTSLPTTTEAETSIEVGTEEVEGSAQSKERTTIVGEIIAPTKDYNPRRVGSYGHRSYAILLKYPQGMSYQSLVAEGARSVDLQWDIKHGHAKIVSK